MESDNTRADSAEPTVGVSRRRVMGGVGVAVAGGLVGGVVGASPASAATSAATSGGGTPATGRAGETLFEFICLIDQKGEIFTGLGYLTAVAGLDRTILFTGDPRDEAHARYLLTANGQLRTANGQHPARSVEGAVHSLNIKGDLAVYYSPSGGAAWSNPAGFSVGIPIATYDLELQDVLTVILPATGIPTLNGVATQTGARVKGYPFGRPGMTSRFTATGIGSRSDTGSVDGAVATLTVAGSMIAT